MENLLIGSKTKLFIYKLATTGDTVRFQVKGHGIVLHSDLSFKPCINFIIKAAFLHLRNIAKIWLSWLATTLNFFSFLVDWITAILILLDFLKRLSVDCSLSNTLLQGY